MRRIVLCALLLLPVAAAASKWNPTEFPLRVHIFNFNGFSHYYDHTLERVDGEGRANLYENGQPIGFDFSYQCGARLMGSPGFETYMARWKKPGRDIEILLPVLGGKPGEMDSCDLKVLLKQDTVYVRHNGLIGEEPASVFKDWMVKHQYDPEHGLNQPVRTPAQPAQAAPASAPNAAPAQPGSPGQQ